MKRFGMIHWAIIDCLLDGNWRTREAIEDCVYSRFMALGAAKPNHRWWKSGTTMSLSWMVNHDWVLTEYDQKGIQVFRITKSRRRLYLNWKKSYERDIANGRVKENGEYPRGRLTGNFDRIRKSIKELTGTVYG